MTTGYFTQTIRCCAYWKNNPGISRESILKVTGACTFTRLNSCTPLALPADCQPSARYYSANVRFCSLSGRSTGKVVLSLGVQTMCENSDCKMPGKILTPLEAHSATIGM